MSELLLAFEVLERPRPKGSLTVLSKTHVKESVDPEGVFRTAVAKAAWSAVTGRPCLAASYKTMPRLNPSQALSGCLETRMLFRFARTPGHLLWAPGDVIEHRKAVAVGDVEKLVRNVHDALQDAGVIHDDHQVTTLGRVGKRFADEDVLQVPGVYVEIWSDDEADALKRDEEFFSHV